MFCGYCGERVPEGASFCPACGAAVLDDEDVPLSARDDGAGRDGDATPVAQSDGARREDEPPVLGSHKARHGRDELPGAEGAKPHGDKPEGDGPRSGGKQGPAAPVFATSIRTIPVGGELPGETPTQDEGSAARPSMAGGSPGPDATASPADAPSGPEGAVLPKPVAPAPTAHGKRASATSSSPLSQLPRWAIPVAAAVVALVVGLVMWTTYSAELWGGRSVPDVSSLSLDEATSALEARGFQVQVEEEPVDDGVGAILSVDPEAGTRVRQGGAIVVTVGVARTVPDVVGQEAGAAQQALEAAGLACQVQQELSDAQAGTVTSTSPAAGEAYRTGDSVTLVVAQPRTLPDVTGASEDEAKAQVEALGLTATVTYRETDDETPGRVVSMSPEAGSTLTEGEEVTLVVAKRSSVTYSGTYFDIVVPAAYASRAQVETSLVDGVQGATIRIDGTYVSAVTGFPNGPVGDPGMDEVIVATLTDSEGHVIQMTEVQGDHTATDLFEEANVQGWVRTH